MSKTILLVDNDKKAIQENTEFLKQSGYNVTVAETAKEALEAVSKSKPDAVVTEIMLEQVDAGFGLCYHLKKDYPELPILVVSDIVRQKEINFGVNTQEQRVWIKADAFIDKPVRPEAIACMLGKHIK